MLLEELLLSIETERLTKGNIAIAHPRRARQVLVRRETSYLIPSKEIPDDGGLASVIAHNQPPGTDVADTVDSQQLYLLGMASKPPFYL